VSDFNENLAAVRRRFMPNEMMLLAGLSMGHAIDRVSFTDLIRKGVAATSGIVPVIIKKYDIKENYLVTKLQGMAPDLMQVLVKRLGEWQGLDIDEMMASNGLPSIDSLARLGLVEPAKGKIAWGWFCYRNLSAIYEYALYNPERMPPTESRTTDELAAELVRLVEASPSPMDDETITDCVYRIMKVTGWRRCLLVADNRGVKVTDIPVKDFLRDRYEGSLKGLVLAGVNAPDSVGH
jgi:hypothetical protein